MAFLHDVKYKKFTAKGMTSAVPEEVAENELESASKSKKNDKKKSPSQALICFSYMGMYNSAIVWLFGQKEWVLEESLHRKINDGLSSYKKKKTKVDEDAEEIDKEGKRGFSFGVLFLRNCLLVFLYFLRLAALAALLADFLGARHDLINLRLDSYISDRSEIIK